MSQPEQTNANLSDMVRQTGRRVSWVEIGRTLMFRDGKSRGTSLSIPVDREDKNPSRNEESFDALD